jgi:putative ABC transport system permease protein
VAIVNDAFRRKYFPGENPVGRRIKMMGTPGSEAAWLTVVGLAGDEKRQDFFHPMNWEEPPMVFRPMFQEPPQRAFMIVDADSRDTVRSRTWQKQIEALDNNVAVGNVEAVEDRLSQTLSYPKFRAVILTAFAVLAVFLAAIGLYAVLSELISQRTREFGVRLALGAQKRDLLKVVLVEGMALALAGLAAGLIITLSLGRFLRTLVYGLRTTDPWTLSAGSLLLILITVLAMYVPAVRASKVDPKVALRSE